MTNLFCEATIEAFPRYNESINAFAIDIYYSSLQHGPDHIRTAPSYFHMGRIFVGVSGGSGSEALCA